MQRVSGLTDEPAAQHVLFGKLPSRADFLRIGPVDDAARAVEAWLTNAVEQSEGAVPEAPVRFLLSHQGTPLFGTWVKSRDEVGRAFPLAYFRPVPLDLAALRWALVPAFFNGFLDSIEALLGTAAATSLDSLYRTTGAVGTPHPSEFVRAIYEAQSFMDSEPISRFGRRAFGDEEGAMPYALLTVREACRAHSAHPTLDVPVSGIRDAFVWLELVASARRAAELPLSFIWSPTLSRGLVSFDAPSVLTLAFLLDAAHRSSSRWPVSTKRIAASEATKELSPALQAALFADASLTDVAAALRAGS